MSSMYIKTQLLLLLLAYNNINAAENVLQNKKTLQNVTFKEELTENKDINEQLETIRLSILQNTVYKSENQNYTEPKYNNTSENVREGLKKVSTNTNATNIHNISLERGKKSILQNGINTIHKSVTIATDIPWTDEFQEKSNTSIRNSKILQFSSDSIASNNSLLEMNEKMEKNIDLDLNQVSIANLQRLSTFTKLSDYASFFALDISEEDSQYIDDIGSANVTTSRDEGSASSSIASNLGRSDRILETYSSDNDIVDGVFASCQPELQTVVLNEPLGTMYLPGCVRLKRCGGCCMGNLLECRPTKIEAIKIKVLKINQNSHKSIMSQPKSIHGRGRGRGSGRGRRRVSRSSRRPQSRNRANLHIVNEWQHTACACQCSVQAHHCHPNVQDYSPNECSCVCKNRSEEKLCHSHSSSHFWDKNSCSCKCKRTLECSTGEIFNTSSCKCSSKPSEEI